MTKALVPAERHDHIVCGHKLMKFAGNNYIMHVKASVKAEMVGNYLLTKVK